MLPRPFPPQGIRMPSRIHPNSSRSAPTTAPASPSSTPSRQESMDEEPSGEDTDAGGGQDSSSSSSSRNNSRVKGSQRIADFAAAAVATAAIAAEDEEGPGGGVRGVEGGAGRPTLSHKQVSALAIAAAVAADPRSAPSSEGRKWSRVSVWLRVRFGSGSPFLSLSSCFIIGTIKVVPVRPTRGGRIFFLNLNPFGRDCSS